MSKRSEKDHAGPCPIMRACGGCAWLGVPYVKQLVRKRVNRGRNDLGGKLGRHALKGTLHEHPDPVCHAIRPLELRRPVKEQRVRHAHARGLHERGVLPHRWEVERQLVGKAA